MEQSQAELKTDSRVSLDQSFSYIINFCFVLYFNK